MHSKQRQLGSIFAISLLFGAATLWGLTVPGDIRQLAMERYGQRAADSVAQWEKLIRESRGLAVTEQLEAANNFFNQHVVWVSDQEAWDAEDYWATPLETMAREVGDCEDFSIAKYATLLLMGVDPTSLRMVYVKLKRSGLTQAHMVLAWYETPGSTPQILDNVEHSIMPATDRGDLIPIFSFNGDAIWAGVRSQPSSADPLARLSRWRQVLTKMRNEGFELAP